MAAAGAALIVAADQLQGADGADVKALVCAITSGFKVPEGKAGSLHAAVDHLFTSSTGKVEGVAGRVHATAIAQSSTSSTLVNFGEQLSRALTAAAVVSPERLPSTSGESPDNADEQAGEDEQTRAVDL